MQPHANAVGAEIMIVATTSPGVNYDAMADLTLATLGQRVHKLGFVERHLFSLLCTAAAAAGGLVKQHNENVDNSD